MVIAAYTTKAVKGNPIGDSAGSEEPNPLDLDEDEAYSQPHCQQLLSDSSIGWLQFGHLNGGGLLIGSLAGPYAAAASQDDCLAAGWLIYVCPRNTPNCQL